MEYESVIIHTFNQSTENNKLLITMSQQFIQIRYFGWNLNW